MLLFNVVGDKFYIVLAILIVFIVFLYFCYKIFLSLSTASAVIFYVCSADFGVWGVPNKHWWNFARCAAHSTMLVIFVALLHIFLLCDFLIHRISLFYQRIGAMWLSLHCFGQRSYSSLTLLRDALNIIIINISNLFGIVTAQCGLQSGEIACLNIHSISPWPILRNHYNKLSNWIISLMQKVWVQYQ